MAVPTVQRKAAGEHPPEPKLQVLMRKLSASLGRPLFAVILAMIAGGIVIMITSGGSIVDRFDAALNAYQSLYMGSFGDPQGLSFTLVKVGPLIFTGISVAIAFRAGLFNIGAEGQLAVGAMTAGIIALKAPHWPGWVLIPLMLIASMLVGAIWGGIVGALKAWRGAHEVVTTIMLNWIAFYVTDYLIDGPFKAPNQATQTSSIPAQATLPRLSTLYNETLGLFLPKIDPYAYTVDVTILIALLALVVYWFITSRTTFGYEIRVLGQNPKAAKYAGIHINRNLFLAMALAGAFSGLAGATRLMGQSPYNLIGATFSIDTTGFDAIGVALLGHTTSIGILLGGLLFGGLRQGGSFMQLNANVPGDLVYIIQALVLFSIASEFLPAIRRGLRRVFRIGNKVTETPVLVTRTGATLVEMSALESEDIQNEDSDSVTPAASREHSADRVEEE
ncbi:ABC transporter permease [Ktedonosporobacter rubrisoli]|uniref:ABC transporter permease n=1 Tax=Ktedonosporobacter rubrisoli TaxID=2509675 RepID=A0A4V0YZS1_KTERU|nr:ABC transporter permease [Ktedonosporobacter rubrisoli]QBD80701.1 ABC transporter permease [Ktedonosporobacter rubrisoli]